MSYSFASFDASGINPKGVTEGYALWSQNYDEMLTDNLDGPILERFKPTLPIANLDVVDLGCGTGRTGAWIQDNVAVRSMNGVDICREMLASAEVSGIYNSVFQRDMTATGLASGSYDLALNVLSACHVPNLAPLYREAFRLLRPSALFLLVDYHPHMLLSGQGTCFPDVEGNMVAIENHVHLLSDHTSIARETGFDYVAFEESLITREWLDQGLKKERFLNHPVGFGYLWRKRP